MKKLLWLYLLSAGCGAAGRAQYTESDHRQTISADLETVFCVSLPETMTAKPVYSPNILSLNKDGVDAATHKRTLEFTARGLGETDLKVGADFSLHIQVTSASDRPGMHIHQH
jgi:hypothetical protein